MYQDFKKGIAVVLVLLPLIVFGDFSNVQGAEKNPCAVKNPCMTKNPCAKTAAAHVTEGIKHLKEAIRHVEEAAMAGGDGHIKEAIEHAKEALKHAEKSGK